MSDQEKPVAITLDNDGDTVEIVHRVDTILEAEEWLADDPSVDKDKLAAGKYGIDAPQAMAEAYARGTLETTEVPEDAPLNDFEMLRATLATLVSRLVDITDPTGDLQMADGPEKDDLAAALRESQQVLELVRPSDAHPFLTTFDEVTTAGRHELIAFLDSGEAADEIADMEALLGGAAWGDTEQSPEVARPMMQAEALRWLRKKAGQAVRALGIAPLYFAIPGMRQLLGDLNEATLVPVIEDYRDGGPNADPDSYRKMVPFVATYDDYAAGQRTVSRAEVQRVAASRREDQTA